jgi:amino acid permease
MYLIMFFSYLRIKKQTHDSGYFTVPGGRIGAYIVAILGMIGCTVTLYVSFIPPESIFSSYSIWYSSMLAIILVLLASPPLLFFRGRRAAGNNRHSHTRNTD